jgi:hypothetical protein
VGPNLASADRGIFRLLSGVVLQGTNLHLVGDR